ncbi:hypothetical protein JKP88DRAFT_251343 [Tribonema minus]|uniref:Uncharacterized protein n=1 Tax=Tribonema minus TaxID=303371 RepID=A0A836CM59_9STRA|nr:hypothetical protein JKP88DRAFT_251343 [Tribonema minus]
MGSTRSHAKEKAAPMPADLRQQLCKGVKAMRSNTFVVKFKPLTALPALALGGGAGGSAAATGGDTDGLLSLGPLDYCRHFLEASEHMDLEWSSRRHVAQSTSRIIYHAHCPQENTLHPRCCTCKTSARQV